MQYVLCPHCLSSLQITEQQLTLKERLIRCGHCNEVFNAYDNPLGQQQTKHLQTEDKKDIISTEAIAVDQLVASWETNKGTSASKKRPYLLIALFLSILLLAQATYINIPLLSQSIPLQETLKQLNKTFNVQIPLYSDLDKIKIIERQLSNHLSSDQALTLQLSIKNTAPIEQPYPNILLLLSSSTNDQLAYISFKPSDYLSPQTAQHPFPSGSIQDIELTFEKPQADVSGFEISFSH